MKSNLKFLLVLTDWAFIIYWTLAALIVMQVVNIPLEYMYADYSNPRVIAWNWSFFPLDILFSVIELLAISRASRNDPSWRPLALTSLVLTMTACGMAITYWVLLLEFNPSWFLANLTLVVWPLFFLRDLMMTNRV